MHKFFVEKLRSKKVFLLFACCMLHKFYVEKLLSKKVFFFLLCKLMHISIHYKKLCKYISRSVISLDSLALQCKVFKKIVVFHLDRGYFFLQHISECQKEKIENQGLYSPTIVKNVLYLFLQDL